MKSSSFKKLVFAAVIFLFNIFNCFSQDNVSVINIESAQNTEYRKNKDTGQEEIILKGQVAISVTKGSTKTVIYADKVTFNRQTDMVYAEGSVSLTQTGSSSGEQNITASTLLFNTSTLEGVFDGGRVVQKQSDAINLPSGSTLIVFSDIFGRDSSNTIAFKNAQLTFCDSDDPHWKIWASRIWLLPGGEFAFFNALLYVGHVPLVYLPAFYYPKDELIFNPSFGYDERLGYYFQTTTYLYGRKPLDTSSDDSDDDDITKGLFNFMKSTSLKEQVREGLVMHNLDSDYKGDTTNYLKIMADYYTNLGVMVGVEGVYKPSRIISSIEGSVKLGFSNTLFENANYSPYYNNKTYSDSSNFMGMKLPFRYSANLKVAMTKPFNFSISMPVYSDPYFTDDFAERSEYIDWLGFLMSGSGDDEEDSTSNTVSSFSWQAKGSYTFNVPQILKPYISSLAISELSASLAFSSRARGSSGDSDFLAEDSYWQKYTPERSFFYPSAIVPLKVTGKISGTLFQTSSSKSSSSTEKKQAITFSVPMEAPESLLTPEEIAKKLEEKSADESEKSAEEKSAVAETETKSGSDTESAEKKNIFSESDLPLLTSSASSSVQSISGVDYSLTYSFTPQYTSQISYQSTTENPIATPEDFQWSKLHSSYYQVKFPATLTSKIGYRKNFISMTNTFSFNGVYQKHPNLDGYEDTSAANVKKTDYAAKKLDLSNSNSVSFKPFINSSLFKNTGIDWNTTVKVIETDFTGDAENPEWDYKMMRLYSKDCVTTHTLSGTISATQGDYTESLVLTTKLPPQTEYYSGTFKFAFPLGSFSVTSGFQQKSSDDETFEKLPLSQTMSLSFFSKTLTLTESYTYKLEEWHHDSFKISAAWKKLSLAYTMSYTFGYDFDKTDGWTIREEKEFLPYSLSLNYSNSGNTYTFWKNRISFSPKINTSVVYDCLRPTNSYFTFSPSLTFKINKFFDLSFSAETRNNVIFRYFQKCTEFKDTIGGEENPFIDLFNSFKFWGNGKFYDPSQTARKNSGFKMKSFKISVTHDLDDWDMTASLTFKPRSVTNSDNTKSYDYHPYFSFSVTWRPMASMKTEIVDEYGKWELNP
ncbi:MAG: hypothetical protein PUI24_00615 [Spirochaetales bacterium]|nr:hypothetical protein [Spirochaetales bacterium]